MSEGRRPERTPWLVRPLAVAAAAAAGAAALLGAQQPGAGQPPVTFRSEINFVEVHAIVTDESGAFVRGLTRDDFEISEDGRPQALSAFSLVELPIEPPAAPVLGADLIEPDVRGTARTFDGRLYVFLLDDLHTDVTRTNQVKEAARRFVLQYLGDGDLAAVVFTSGRQEAGQELTSSRRLLLAAIDRFVGRKLPSAGAEKLALHLRQAAQRASVNVYAIDPRGLSQFSGLVDISSRSARQASA